MLYNTTMDGMIGNNDGNHSIAELKGAIIGFRRWTIKNGMLCSPHRPGHKWQKGINTAQCSESMHPQKKVVSAGGFLADALNSVLGGHTLMMHTKTENAEIPHKDCTCGLYAYRGYEHLFGNNSKEIIGAVLMWGRIEVHESGFRSEKALPVLLVDNPNNKAQPKLSEIAIAYQMQIIKPENLAAKAKQIGHVYSDEEWKIILGE